MGTIYRTSFMPYLELFEPRSAYISELRLQHAWKNVLWKNVKQDALGRELRILSPGRHNHSDGPDFIDARIVLDGKLRNGDIEIHKNSNDWYNHGHHLDPAYERCMLHVVFQTCGTLTPARCANGNVLPSCIMALDDVVELDPPVTCRIFKAEPGDYFNILTQQAWKRINKKVEYFYKNRLRFPDDVMLYWGLFKACGYRYNEENMISLFMRFPWAAYCDELIDRRDIIPMLMELAGFVGKTATHERIRWTYSRTRPAHFPEKRIAWLGHIMTHYYGASLSDILYETCREHNEVKVIISRLLLLQGIENPGEMLLKEMILNTILPLMEAMRREKNDSAEFRDMLWSYVEQCRLVPPYGTVRRFHDLHGIPVTDERSRQWLTAQGVLEIRDRFCLQGVRDGCPICSLTKNGG